MDVSEPAISRYTPTSPTPNVVASQVPMNSDTAAPTMLDTLSFR